jgi:hypothetical protein
LSSEDAFNKRAKTGDFPPFYPFKEANDAVTGRVISTSESQFSTKEKPQIVFHILTSDEIEYCLPTSTVAMSLYESTKIKVGDYAKMVFLGETPSKRFKGKFVKTFSLAVIPADEFEKLYPRNAIKMPTGTTKTKRPEPEAPTPAPAPAPAAEPAGTQEDLIKAEYTKLLATGILSDFQIAKALSEKFKVPLGDLKRILAAKAAPPKAAADNSKAIGFMNDILAFYDVVPKTQLPELLKAAEIDMTTDQIIEACKDTVQVSADGMISKKA